MSEEAAADAPAEAPEAEEPAPAADEAAAEAPAAEEAAAEGDEGAKAAAEPEELPSVDENSVKSVFEKYAEGDAVAIAKLPEILAEMNLPTPPELDSIVSSVVEDAESLSFSDLLTVCGVIRGLSEAVTNVSAAKGRGRRVGKPSYLESGNITEDEAVLGFLRALEEHRKKCEKEGKYMEARVAAKRLNDLKVHEEQKRKQEVKARHLSERLDAERAFAMEQEQHNKLWEEKIMEYEALVAEQMDRLKKLHIAKFEEFRQEAEGKAPRRPQFSKELLNQRKIQENLAKQRKYVEAESLRRMADKMEGAELQATIATYEAEVSLKGQQLKAKQQQEMEALLQRATRTRNEMRITRDLDFERRKQRFRNVMAELENLQKLENVQLEYFLEMQSIAGKRDTVSAQKYASLS